MPTKKATPPAKPAAKPTTPAKETKKKEEKPVEVKPEVEETKEETVDAFTDLLNSYTQLTNMIKEMGAKIKVYSKEREKNMKIINKEAAKREKAKKTPSGFAKPTKISDEMCSFMKIPNGSERSRTDVTRYINAYVKEKNLYNPVNRRIILPDDTLKKLLRVGENDEVSFFIIQKLLSSHFPLSKAKLAAQQAQNA